MIRPSPHHHLLLLLVISPSHLSLGEALKGVGIHLAEVDRCIVRLTTNSPGSTLVIMKLVVDILMT